jgi:hypothetical protein
MTYAQTMRVLMATGRSVRAYGGPKLVRLGVGQQAPLVIYMRAPTLAAQKGSRVRHASAARY